MKLVRFLFVSSLATYSMSSMAEPVSAVPNPIMYPGGPNGPAVPNPIMYPGGPNGPAVPNPIMYPGGPNGPAVPNSITNNGGYLPNAPKISSTDSSGALIFRDDYNLINKDPVGITDANTDVSQQKINAIVAKNPAMVNSIDSTLNGNYSGYNQNLNLKQFIIPPYAESGGSNQIYYNNTQSPPLNYWGGTKGKAVTLNGVFGSYKVLGVSDPACSGGGGNSTNCTFTVNIAGVSATVSSGPVSWSRVQGNVVKREPTPDGTGFRLIIADPRGALVSDYAGCGNGSSAYSCGSVTPHYANFQ